MEAKDGEGEVERGGGGLGNAPKRGRGIAWRLKFWYEICPSFYRGGGGEAVVAGEACLPHISPNIIYVLDVHLP